jgi:hypothetical protein
MNVRASVSHTLRRALGEDPENLSHAYSKGRHDGMVKARQEIYRLAQRQGWDARLGTAWKTLDDMIHGGRT